jgi:DNA gyrase subunit A
LDEVIKLIRASRTPDEAKENLIAKSREEKWYLNQDIFADLTDDLPSRKKVYPRPGQSHTRTAFTAFTGMERDKIVDEFNGLMPPSGT